LAKYFRTQLPKHGLLSKAEATFSTLEDVSKQLRKVVHFVLCVFHGSLEKNFISTYNYEKIRYVKNCTNIYFDLFKEKKASCEKVGINKTRLAMF
jgi:hypothetical protein